jgi:hypothetical protein
VPEWRRVREQYGALIKSCTVGSLREAVKNLNAIGSQIRDPKGMLLTRQQRTQRAGDVLGMAFALALVEAGWELRTQPGFLRFQHRDEERNPFQIVQQLATGKLTAADWLARSKALGIEGLVVGSPVTQQESVHPKAPAADNVGKNSAARFVQRPLIPVIPARGDGCVPTTSPYNSDVPNVGD